VTNTFDILSTAGDALTDQGSGTLPRPKLTASTEQIFVVQEYIG